MKQSKHTPGPWTVEYNGDGCIVSFDNGPVVYDTTEETEESRNDVAELEANARLISAAPELLHALTCLLNDLQSYTANTFDGQTHINMVAAAQVIERATGGAK